MGSSSPDGLSQLRVAEITNIPVYSKRPYTIGFLANAVSCTISHSLPPLVIQVIDMPNLLLPSMLTHTPHLETWIEQTAQGYCRYGKVSREASKFGHLNQRYQSTSQVRDFTTAAYRCSPAYLDTGIVNYLLAGRPCGTRLEKSRCPHGPIIEVISPWTRDPSYYFHESRRVWQDIGHGDIFLSRCIFWFLRTMNRFSVPEFSMLLIWRRWTAKYDSTLSWVRPSPVLG